MHCLIQLLLVVITEGSNETKRRWTMLVAIEFGMTLQIIMKNWSTVFADNKFLEKGVEHAGNDILPTKGESGRYFMGLSFA